MKELADLPLRGVLPRTRHTRASTETPTPAPTHAPRTNLTLLRRYDLLPDTSNPFTLQQFRGTGSSLRIALEAPLQELNALLAQLFSAR